MSRKDDIINELKSSFDADTTRSKIGRVREIYDVIAELKDGGMNLKKIVEILNKPDFNLDLDAPTLSSYLYMIRKKRGLDRVVVVPATPATQEAPKPPKARKGKDKGPATPDSMDEKKPTATATPKPETPAVANENESEDGLTEKQKRERKASQYLSNDETSSFFTNFIKPKE